MNTPPRVDRLLARAVDEQVGEQRLLREALEDVAARLDRVEVNTAALVEKIEPWSDPGAATGDLALRLDQRIAKRFEELQMALDDMGVAIEQRALDAVSDDMTEVADELRRAVNDLARLMVRDRKRISHLLTEHRNAILAELRLTPEEPTVDIRDDGALESSANGGRRTLRRLLG